jgi:serine/threonine protein phosphatase PrpC
MEENGGAHRSECAIIAAGGGSDEDPEKVLIASRSIPAYRIIPKDKREEDDNKKSQDVTVSLSRHGTHFVGVFDGHDGPGLFAATEAAKVFSDAFKALPESALDSTNWYDWLSNTTDDAQKLLLGSMELAAEEGGTSFVVAVIHKGEIFSGGVGDTGFAVLDTWTQDGTVVVTPSYWASRPIAKPPLEYPIGPGRKYSSERTDALGHVIGQRHFKTTTPIYYQGRFAQHPKLRLGPDNILLIGSDGFFDLMDSLRKDRLTAAPSGSSKRTKSHHDYADDDDEYGFYDDYDDDDKSEAKPESDDDDDDSTADEPDRESLLDATLREAYDVRASKMVRKLTSNTKKMWRKLWEKEENQKEDITLMIVKPNTPVDKLDKV